MTDEQFVMLMNVLCDIRELLQPLPVAEPSDVPCSHPDDRRINLSGMGHAEWTCKDCDFYFNSREGA